MPPFGRVFFSLPGYSNYVVTMTQRNIYTIIAYLPSLHERGVLSLSFSWDCSSAGRCVVESRLVTAGINISEYLIVSCHIPQPSAQVAAVQNRNRRPLPVFRGCFLVFCEYFSRYLYSFIHSNASFDFSNIGKIQHSLSGRLATNYLQLSNSNITGV